MPPVESSAYMESSAPPCQVDELLSVMRGVKRHPDGYRAVHLRFSLLDRAHQQPYHRRTIATAFNKLVHSNKGQLFWTKNFDVVFICQGSSLAQLDIAVLAARRAVEESPIVKEYIEAARDDELCDWYDLTKDMDRFMDMAGGLKAATEQGGEQQSSAPAPSLKSMISNLNQELSHGEDTPPQADKPAVTTRPLYDPIAKKDTTVPMGPIQLDQLERNLVNMEIDRMIAAQTAYVIVGEAKPQPIFVEYYVSVVDIKENLLPNYDMYADKWLFQRLTRAFDAKLMQILPGKDQIGGQVISININVETVLTPEFDKFIAQFKQKNNQPLILEMGLFDVISDIEKYYAAREKLTQLGCRISLDAIDIQALTVLDRELMAVDFLKIHWKPENKKFTAGAMKDKIISAIAAQGKMRIILCHCDSETAFQFGKSVGIHMYQGFLIDKKTAL